MARMTRTIITEDELGAKLEKILARAGTGETLYISRNGRSVAEIGNVPIKAIFCNVQLSTNEPFYFRFPEVPV